MAQTREPFAALKSAVGLLHAYGYPRGTSVGAGQTNAPEVVPTRESWEIHELDRRWSHMGQPAGLPPSRNGAT